MSRKQAYITFSIMGVLLFIFGQNFELVPRNRLFSPQENNYMDIRMPARIQEFNPIKKYFLDRPPQFTAADMTFAGVAEKSWNKVVENYFEGDQFENSEMGRSMREIESRTQTSFTVGSSEDGTPTEFSFRTNSTQAFLTVKNDLVNTTCGYSLRNQTIDMQFQTSKLPNQSFVMGYDIKSTSGSVKMQMNW